MNNLMKFSFFLFVIVCFQYIHETFGATFHFPIYYFLLGLPLDAVFWVNVLYNLGMSALLATVFVFSTRNIWIGYLSGIVFLTVGKLGWYLGFLKGGGEGVSETLSFVAGHAVFLLVVVPVIYFLYKFFHGLSVKYKRIITWGVLIICFIIFLRESVHCSIYEPSCQAYNAFIANDIKLCNELLGFSPHYMVPTVRACRAMYAQKVDDRQYCINLSVSNPWVKEYSVWHGDYSMPTRNSPTSLYPDKKCVRHTSPQLNTDKQILQFAYYGTHLSRIFKAKDYSFDRTTGKITYSEEFRDELTMDDGYYSVEMSEEKFILRICYEEYSGDLEPTLLCFKNNHPHRGSSPLFYYLESLGYK